MQTMRVAFSLFFAFSVLVHAQEAVMLKDVDVTYTAEVKEVLASSDKDIANTGVKQKIQSIKVTFTSGDKIGKSVTLDDDLFESKVGESIFVRYMKTSDGVEYYSIVEPNRLNVLLWLTILFIVVVILFGGKHGMYALVALVISFGAIFTILFPRLLAGWDPIITSLLIAGLSLFVVMFFSHGWNRVTLSAYLGCAVAVCITAFLAKYAVVWAKLSGFSDESSVYLNLATNGTLHFQSLLIAAIIIGVIGVVDDVAITQASVVAQLFESNPKLSKREVYLRAMKVGKDHSAALINTLVLAYAGASLPLLLLLYTSKTPTLQLINMESISVEIVRTIVGSIGLVILVPCATLISVFLIRKEDVTHAHSHMHNH